MLRGGFPRQSLIPEELQRKWLEKRGVTDDQWNLFASYLEDARALTNNLLDAVEDISTARRWWIDVQAAQRYFYAHPLRIFAPYSTCISGFAKIFPCFYPAWVSNMGEVEQRIDILEKVHAELCRYVGFLHYCIYRLVQWRAKDPASRAEEALENCKEQVQIQSRVLADLVQSLRSLETTGVKSPNPDGALMQGIRSLKSFRFVSPVGSLFPARMAFPIDDRTHAVRNVQALQEAIQSSLFLHRMPRHISRWRGVYFMSVVGSVIVGFYTHYMGRGLRVATVNGITQAQVFLRQFAHEWFTVPCAQLLEQLFPAQASGPVVADLVYERQTLSKMTRHFYNLLEVPITSSVETKLCEGDISVAVDYFEEKLGESITAVMRGFLIESSMIQAQKMKVVMYDLCKRVDSMMNQVRLNVALSSIFPASYLVYMLCIVAKRRSGRLRTTWVRTCRRHLNDVDRALCSMDRISDDDDVFLKPVMRDRKLSWELHSSDGRKTDGSQSINSRNRDSTSDLQHQMTERQIENDATSLHALSRPQVDWEKCGLLISHVCALWNACARRLEASDLQTFEQDVYLLTSPDLTVSQKLHVVTRMRMAYACFDYSR